MEFLFPDEIEWRRQAARFPQPMVEPLHAFVRVYFRRPSGGRFETARVGDVVTLVARPPVLELDGRLLSLQALHQLQQFEEADGVSQAASDIEGLSGESVNVGLGEE